MTNGECSKCKSNTVYAIESWGQQKSLLIGILIPPAVITYLVCTKCGYFESYIFDKKSLADIERKGMRVTPAQKN
jgi:hypothetical protein